MEWLKALIFGLLSVGCMVAGFILNPGGRGRSDWQIMLTGFGVLSGIWAMLLIVDYYIGAALDETLGGVLSSLNKSDPSPRDSDQK